MDDPREVAYIELLPRCRRMARLRDHDPAKLRFFWGSLFVNVSVEVGGLAWSDVDPLWQRWQGIADGCPQPSPSTERRRARHRRSRRSHRGGRGGPGRRRGWWREPPFPRPEPE